MSAPPDPQVQDFERQLDEALAARPMVRYGGTDALRLAAKVVETALAMRPTHSLADGLHILAPALIGRTPGDEIDIADVLADLQFATHYFHLRDLLYFTYNAPGSMAWTFDQATVAIRFADISIPRQFFMSWNNWFLDSIAAFAEEQPGQRIRSLLRGTPEFEMTAEAIEAQNLIQQEVDIKFDLYFNLVSDPSVTAGEYTFADFFKVYEALLMKALYHRYHSEVNSAYGAISMPLADLARDLEDSVENVSADTASRVVADISYGAEAHRARLNPVYFSLYHLPDQGEIIMLPHDFATWEGFVSFLRLIALRDPELFLGNFSNQIGNALVSRVAKSFGDAGFHVRTNVALRGYDVELPDIDVLVISEERTLGYVIFVCEVKGPVPPGWAKDQLRVLEPDSIAKAFGQLERIYSFLHSDAGAQFLREQLPPEGLPDFDEMAVLVHGLVATSHNTGAFFDDRETTIIDFRTLERLLSRCDGDILYVLQALKGIPEWADNSFDRAMDNVQVGDIAVSYEGITFKHLMDFEQNAYRSAGAPDELVSGMLDLRARPLDIFRERGVDFGD